MPEIVNTSSIKTTTNFQDEDKETIIDVSNVSMVFNMASEQLNNIKEYAIALAKRELRFKEFRALNNINLQVKKGDVYGILGTNGSGKSTILKIIAGVLEPSEGSVSVKGSIAPLIELGAGFDMDLTARENIYLNGALLGYSKHFIDEHFDEIVDFAEVSKFLDIPIKNYSSGMVARIAFAIATVIIPDILIVDEVLSVGDFMFQQKCERRIQALIKEHQVTVLIVSHNTDQIERLCNKAVWIEKGQERIIGTAKEVCQIYRVLGGHTGSPEAENAILNLLESPINPDQNCTETVSGDDRYSTSVKVLDEIIKDAEHVECILLAPGDNADVCLLANSYASTINAPVLLTRNDHLPDIIQQKIKQLKPDQIILFGGSELITEEVKETIVTTTPSSVIIRINENNLANLANRIFDLEQLPTASQRAVLTYPGCLNDMLCLLPYICREQLPIFFNKTPDSIDEGILNRIIAANIKEVLIVGGFKSFPEKTLECFNDAGIKTIRFAGENAYAANDLINSWIMGKDAASDKTIQLFLLPLWNPVDFLSAGSLAAMRNAIILFEDNQNLDSVSRVFKFIRSNPSLKKVVFFGGNAQFNALDKKLVAKCLSKTQQKK